ncbi:MAG: DinB family protein [Owenweeksia sp.]|nr:DinB family protein [Owenweeksia sp.]
MLQLLEYNLWANDQFIVHLKEQAKLPEAINKPMSHLLLAHTNWLAPINEKTEEPNVWAILPTAQWEERNLQIFHQSTDLVKSGNLEVKKTYQHSRGIRFVNSLIMILFHLMNHSTHHRAQVALLMRENDIIPPASDLIFYLRC